MERAILIFAVLGVLAVLSGCFGPGYDPAYGYGYAPYSYGYPVYTHGYHPDFIVRHPWEEHHAYGHPGNFYRSPHSAAHGPAEHGGGGGGGHGGRH